MKRLPALLILLFALTVPGTGRCLEQDVRQQTLELIKGGQFQEAIEIINETSPARDDKDALFLSGMAYARLGDHNKAIEIYQAFLAIEDNSRVRLELASSYVAIGDFAQAKKEFETVLGRPIPEQVKQNITRQLAAISARKNWTLGLALGVLYDSNINSAPGDPDITVSGLPFQLDEDSLSQGSWGYKGELSYSHNFRVPFANSLALQLWGSHTDYERGTTYDTSSLLIGLTPSWNFWKTTARLGVRYTNSWLDGKTDRETYGIAPELYYRIDDKLIATLKSTIDLVNDLSDNSDKEGWQYWVRLGGLYYYSQDTIFDFGASRAEEKYRYEIDSTDANGLDIALTQKLPYDLTFYVKPSATYVRYRGIQATDQIRRKDERYNFFTSLAWDYQLGDYTITPSIEYTYTVNESNVARNEYERTKVAFMTRMLF